MSKRVEVEIDRLVLHGVPAAQRRAIREAVEHEVAREVARRAGEGSLQDSAQSWTLPAAPAGRRQPS